MQILCRPFYIDLDAEIHCNRNESNDIQDMYIFSSLFLCLRDFYLHFLIALVLHSACLAHCMELFYWRIS